MYVCTLGNEGCGLPQESACIHPLRRLPLGFDSMNVSKAMGIILYTLQISKIKKCKQTFIS